MSKHERTDDNIQNKIIRLVDPKNQERGREGPARGETIRSNRMDWSNMLVLAVEKTTNWKKA